MLRKGRTRRKLSPMEAPETRYAKSGDVNIAYSVSGDGRFDLVFVPGFVGHLELEWQLHGFVPFLEQLSSFSRLIRFDKRGTGMSDRVAGAPTLETRMDDVRAVMDAAGSRKAAFYGLSEGAAMSILFAATYPDRTAALVVRSAYPRRMWAPDYPWGLTERDYAREVEHDLGIFSPRQRAIEAVRALGHFTDTEAQGLLDVFRYGSSPGALEELHRMNKEIDIRHVLPAVRVPTLILCGGSGARKKAPPPGARAMSYPPLAPVYCQNRQPGFVFPLKTGRAGERLAFNTLGLAQPPAPSSIRARGAGRRHPRAHSRSGQADRSRVLELVSH
jgi:pimeloyl-ACP methyl ester carboxylesterase